MATISGILGGLLAKFVLHTKFIFGFMGLFTFSFIIESFFAYPTEGKSMNWLRISIAILFAMLHAIAVDTMVFQQDIENYYTEVHQERVLGIDSLYDSKRNKVSQEIAQLQTKKDSLNSILDRWSERQFSEIDSGRNGRKSGEGKFSRKWEEMRQIDSVHLAPNMAQIDGSISELRAYIASLEHEKQEKIDDLIKSENRGLKDHLKAIWHFIIIDGDALSRGIYIGAFLLVLFFECIVILVKRRFHLAYLAYHREARNQQQRDDALNDFKSTEETNAQKSIAQQRIQLSAEEVKMQNRLAHERRIKQLESDHRSKNMERDSKEFNHSKSVEQHIKTSSNDQDFTRWQQKNGQHRQNGSL